MRDTIVVGLGSSLMRDEGIGTAVVRRLQASAGRFPDVDLLDVGTASMRALHAIAGRRKAVFVDCAFMGAEPGTMRRFTPDQVKSCKVLPRFSVHEGDLLATIELSRRLGECPREVVIFGIQPQVVEPGEELSPALAARLDDYVEMIAAELA